MKESEKSNINEEIVGWVTTESGTRFLIKGEEDNKDRGVMEGESRIIDRWSSRYIEADDCNGDDMARWRRYLNWRSEG